MVKPTLIWRSGTFQCGGKKTKKWEKHGLYVRENGYHTYNAMGCCNSGALKATLLLGL